MCLRDLTLVKKYIQCLDTIFCSSQLGRLPAVDTGKATKSLPVCLPGCYIMTSSYDVMFELGLGLQPDTHKMFKLKTRADECAVPPASATDLSRQTHDLNF